MVLPISCNECRRRKIRCNRIQPCKNCTERCVECTYPAKFRSIELSKLAPTEVKESASTLPTSTSSNSPNQSNDSQNDSPLPGSTQLQQPTPPHSSTHMRSIQPSHSQQDPQVNADTQSRLEFYEQRIKELEAKLRTTEDLVSIFDSTGTSHSNHFGAQSLQSLEYSLLGRIDHPPLIPDSSSQNSKKPVRFCQPTGNGTEATITKVKNKRPLPIMIPGNEVANMNLLNKLVKKFFDPTKLSFFNDMFKGSEVLWFLNNHARLDPWDHDDDMMVLLAILIDSLKQSLLSTEKALIKEPKGILRALVNYYFQVSKCQETETIKFIKSQVILINYFYYCYEFEKAWKMMFSTVSNAYAHGIHIVQGPVWKNLSLLEAVFCSMSSRPNVIHGLTKINITEEEDPLREYEFMNILRDRNMSHIEASIIGAEIKYQQVLQFDLRFESYNNCLLNMINIGPPVSPYHQTLHDRAYGMLIISLSNHMKLHLPYFEKDRFSDMKMMELISQVTNAIVCLCRDEISTLRDLFTCLECNLYQILLIFIKYLNFKIVNSLLQPDISHEDKSHMNDELSKLFSCHSQLLNVFELDKKFCNKAILQAIGIIQSLHSSELNSKLSVVSATPGRVAGYYANDSVKDILESSLFMALSDISEIEPQFSFDDTH